jgi:RHS repeat-associated protein
VSSVTWLPFGPAREITYPHRTQTRRYDLNYAIDAIYATGGLTLDFAVDVLGNPTAVATSLGGPPARTYTYDALNRLRAALHAGQPVEQFTHDLTVNRLKKSGSPRSPVVSYDYEPTSHRLIAVDGFARQYDAAGNQINGFLPGVQSFIAYGDHNRPIGWTIPRQGQGLCRHNARGERVYMRTPDDTAREIEQFVTHAETGQRLETRRGAATQTLVWLEDLPVGVIDGGVVHAIESDHLGTPRLAARLDTGATTWTWDFTGSSFGDHAPRETGLVLDLRYPGQHYDRHTGWHYNYFRDYDPTTGRYIESDPIGLAGGINTFAYVDSSPMFAADSFGLAPQVQGWWITPPRFNLVRVGLDGLQLVPVHWSWWGYLAFLRVYGHADGFVNIDVGCRAEREDDCGQRSQREWEIHSRINIRYSGYFDWGPNIYATLIGMRAGFVGALGANAALGGAAALQAEYQMLQGANEKAGPVIRQLLQNGPTAMCLLHANAQ